MDGRGGTCVADRLSGMPVMRKQKLCPLCILLMVLLPAACGCIASAQSQRPAPTTAVSQCVVELEPAMTPEPASNAQTDATMNPALRERPVYDPLRLPEYAKSFLGDALGDYYAVIAAVEAGETSVQLSGRADFARVERTIHALYAPKMLLYDAKFIEGKGPFEYADDTGCLTIRYVYGRETHLALIGAFSERINAALSQCRAGAAPEEWAEALFLWVVENLRYVLDMRLTVYDAVTTGSAYCQTYAELYQLLLTQAGISCYLVGGSVDLDGDGVADGEHEWNRLWLNGAWAYADPTWDRGDLAFYAMTRDECIRSGHLEPYLDPCDALLH